MEALGEVNVDSTDLGCSDHFLVWMELGRATQSAKREKRVIRKWRLERFDDAEVKHRYCSALKDEVSGFVESISRLEQSGYRGVEIVERVLLEWEGIVNRVARV